VRESIIILIGILGGAVASIIGGWDLALQTLVFFMGIDFVTGFIVAAVYKRSRKSSSGTLNSRIGFKGILKKCMMLTMIIMGYQLDRIIGWDFVRYAMIIAFLVNESVSIIENAGLMGVPIPNVLRQAIEILRTKSGEDVKGETGNDPK